MVGTIGIIGRLPCRYPIVPSFSLYTRNNSAHNLIPTVTGKEILRCTQASHPWVFPKLSLVSVHAALHVAALLTSGDAEDEVDPGRQAGPYTTG